MSDTKFKKRLAMDCSSDFSTKSIIGLEASISVFIGIIQGLQFAVDREEQLREQVKCPNCVNEIKKAQEEIGKMLYAAQTARDMVRSADKDKFIN